MKTSSLQRTLKKANRSFLFFSYRLKFSIGSALAPRHTARQGATLFCSPTRPNPAKLALAADMPSPKMRELTLSGKTISIYQWGDPISQPTVLLVHGWNGWGLQFSAFLPNLLEKGWAVIAVDHVGHGKSQGTTASLPTFIRTVKDLLDEFPTVHGIVAHSLGAAAAAYVMAESGTRLVNVVLLAPPRHPRVYLDKFAALLGISSTIVDLMQRWIEARFDLPFTAVDVERVAPMLNASTLIIHDPDDEVVPFSHGARYAELAQRAKLIALKDVGHYKMLQSREVIRLAVEFLTPAPAYRTGSTHG